MQTISAKLAKQLKELGVKQNSYSSWIFFKELEQINLCSNSLETILINQGHHAIDIYAAFTLDEILEMLPVIKRDDINHYPLVHKAIDNLYCTFYVDCQNNKYLFIEPQWEKNNPAEAAGQLLVWCIENNHINPEKNNEN